MIQVPDEIKALLHQDTCKKNIRIHFPNGERSDICNDLIVKDSVSFTESLCSQNELKFGLCEASVFECETVGVGNIKGAMIEVSCEIYCDSNVMGAVWQNDLEAYVYVISYGTFAVSSCARQADMIHRKITAYGGTSLFSNEHDMLNYIVTSGQQTATAYQPNIFNTMVMTSNSTAPLDDAPLTELVCDEEAYTVCYKGDSFSETYRGIRLKCVRYTVSDIGDTLYFTERTKPDKNLSEILKILKPMYSDIHRDLKEAMAKVRWDGIAFATNRLVPPTGQPIQAFSPGAFIYPYQACIDYYTYLLIPYEMQYVTGSLLGYGDLTIISSYQFRDPAEQKIYSVDTSNYPQFRLYYPRDIEDSYLYYFDRSELDFAASLRNIMELHGVFLNLNRENAIKLINIKRQFGLDPSGSLYPGQNVYPQGVTGGKLLPEDYQSCWYDDQYTKLFGAVKCTYRNSNNEDIEYVKYIGDITEYDPAYSYLTYDFSDNEYLNSVVWTEELIEAICQTIADNIEGVSYMPVDFVGRGLPYVEAGDTFEILTKLNDSITTIVLNRTLKGEQTLTDQYKTTGAEEGDTTWL